ncbi:MAG: COX15/CtaA family protein [Bacteroidia bacterium]|nr:COX15/CtaA family protein [Bacteroidia bacterium]MCX7652185.1 COX15/CtaA family protein [Bacteroidia bacterium]MDW8416447.1 COX15/CtaA family protein [Bacteroidia bacterium]
MKDLYRFRRLVFLVFVLFLLVILAGVSVRVLEAGMGCPDWPTCYGQLIPPIRESQLPPDYRERFAVGGRLAEPFDPLKTWTEYVNRLLSVVAGIAVLVATGYAWLYLRRYPKILTYTTAIPVLLIIQSLLGWRVVATYLAEHMITIHMIFSVLLTLCALLSWAHTFQLGSKTPTGELQVYYILGWVGLGLLVIQILLGASLRAIITEKGIEAGTETLNFFIHRSFSWIVLGTWAYYHWRLFREPTRQPFARRWAILTTISLVLQVLIGAFMSYVSFAGLAKVAHLWLALFSLNTGFMSLFFFRNSVYGGAHQPIHQLSA